MVVGIITGMATPRQDLIMVILTASHIRIITDHTTTTEETGMITTGTTPGIIPTANPNITIREVNTESK
jgi:hypothetical protein